MTRGASKIYLPVKIAAEIGRTIVSGQMTPGAILEGEIDASGGRNVSRSAYREAVRILAAKGLVCSRPKIGTRVMEPNQWHLLDPEVLAWIFAGDPPRNILENLFELRKLVEPESAALAAERRSSKQLNLMSEALETMARETLHTERGRAADEVFHAVLLSASENRFLVALSSSVAAAVAWSTKFKERTQRLRRDPMPDHVKVYEAIAARDPRAARNAMADLIRLALADAVLAGRGRGARSSIR